MTPAAPRALPPGRCGACAFPPSHCICGEAPRLVTPVRFVVIRHASELPRLTSTARWAALALPGAELLDYALPGAPFDGERLRAPGTWALFPSAGPTPPGAPRPGTLVVPDGTWQQARRMMQRVPALRELPRLSLAPPAPAARLRRPPRPGGVSTMEAMAAALDHLGHPAEARALRAFHDLAVARAAALRGFPPVFG